MVDRDARVLLVECGDSGLKDLEEVARAIPDRDRALGRAPDVGGRDAGWLGGEGCGRGGGEERAGGGDGTLQERAAGDGREGVDREEFVLVVSVVSCCVSIGMSPFSISCTSVTGSCIIAPVDKLEATAPFRAVAHL